MDSADAPLSDPSAARRKNRNWTRRQREVLDLLARGKTNGEIGKLLGISLDGAKWHVSGILEKLDATSRDEVAEYWRRQKGLPARLKRLVAVSTAVAPMQLIGFASAVLGSAVIVGAGLVVWQAAGVSDGDAPAAERGDGAPSPDMPFFIGPEMALPASSSVYVAVSCLACVRPDLDLVRLDTNGQGDTTSNPLAEPSLLPGEIISAFALSRDASLIGAVTCIAEQCGGLGYGSDDARGRVFVSKNGGKDWRLLGELIGFLRIEAGPGEALLVVQGRGGAESSGWSESYYTAEDGRLVEMIRPGGALPAILADGSVGWFTRSGDLLDTSGNVTVSLAIPPNSQVVQVHATADLHYAVWTEPLTGPSAPLLALYAATGQLRWTRPLLSSQSWTTVTALSSLRTIETVHTTPLAYTPSPAIGNLQTGEVTPFGSTFSRWGLPADSRLLALVIR